MPHKHYITYALISMILSGNAITQAILTYAPDGTIYDPDKAILTYGPDGTISGSVKGSYDPSKPMQRKDADAPLIRYAPPQNPFAPAETGTGGIQNKNPSRSSTSGISVRTK
jgi:hypothetical protein